MPFLCCTQTHGNLKQAYIEMLYQHVTCDTQWFELRNDLNHVFPSVAHWTGNRCYAVTRILGRLSDSPGFWLIQPCWWFRWEQEAQVVDMASFSDRVTHTVNTSVTTVAPTGWIKHIWHRTAQLYIEMVTWSTRIDLFFTLSIRPLRNNIPSCKQCVRSLPDMTVRGRCKKKHVSVRADPPPPQPQPPEMNFF